jgi:Aldo/keto reductase family
VSVLALGTHRFGTETDEETSFAILDRFAQAGGTFIDTADNYAFWINGTQGGESERLPGGATGREPGRGRPGPDRRTAHQARHGPVTILDAAFLDAVGHETCDAGTLCEG